MHVLLLFFFPHPSLSTVSSVHTTRCLLRRRDGTLYLQGTQPDNQDVPSRRRSRQRVVWTEDTVDNEGCGKKKSKSTCIATHISVCCIYHKKRAFDESSSESSASSDGDDSEPDISSSDDGEPTSARSLPSSHTHGAGCSHSSKPPPRNAYERS